MRKLLFLAVPMLFSLSSWTASAEGLIKLGAMYINSTDEVGGSKSETTRTLIDIGAGYITSQGWTFGALYAQEKIDSGDNNVERTSMGPTVGWISRKESGPYILANYFIKSEYEDYEGTGYQFDFGYKFGFGKIAVAMQLSYKQFTYDEVNGAKLDDPYKAGRIDPYFVVMVEF